MQRTGTYQTPERHATDRAKSVEVWLGNSLATILTACAVVAGGAGLLLHFGFLNEDGRTPFEDGVIWLTGALILAIGANVFRREPNLVDTTPFGGGISRLHLGEHHANDVVTWLGNSLATILVGLALAAGAIGVFVHYGYLNEDTTTPFRDGLLWLIAGVVLSICGNVFRREHHVVTSATEAMSPRDHRGEPPVPSDASGREIRR